MVARAGAWPLTGRAEELAYVDAALLRAGGIVLAGSAGVGKTRLAREATERAERNGRTARSVTATGSTRSIPLGAFAHLVGHVGGSPAELLHRASAALLRESKHGRLLLFVDDAHLLDELSASLVHHLATQRLADLVVTIRTGEPAPSAVTAVWKDRSLERLELQVLSAAESATLLEAVLGSSVDSQCSRRMWELAQGNVLYLRHLVEGELAAGRLRQTGGVWRWSGTPTVTNGLAELVRSRIGDLPDGVAEVVDVLALAEPLEVDLAVEVVSRDALERAESHGLVRICDAGGRSVARLAHPLYGEVRRSELGSLRGKRLRGRVARVLAESGGGTADDILRLAVLALGSDYALDPELVTAAAERAAEVIDFELALRLGRAATAAGGGFRAQSVVTFASTWTGDSTVALAEVDELVRLAGSDAELSRAAMHRAITRGWVDGRPDEAIAVLELAVAQVIDDRDRQPLLALRAMFDAVCGRPAAALDLGQRCLALVSPPSDETVLIGSCAVVAARSLLGLPDCDGLAERGMLAARRSRELGFVLVPLLAVTLLGQRLSGALSVAARVTDASREQLKDVLLGAEVGSYLSSELELARGHATAAIRWAREAEAGLAHFGDRGGFRYANMICLTRALALAGDVAEAREAAAEMALHKQQVFGFLDPHSLLADSAVAAASGALTQARDLARSAARLAAEREQYAHEVLALQVAVSLGDRAAGTRLAELATKVAGPRVAVAAAYAVACAEGDGEGLLAVSEDFERLGDGLAAAEAAAQASVRFRQLGRMSTAHAAADRASRLATACGGLRTPSLREAARPLPLTARELEIVSMAAQGMSNREIAGRLVVSVRTVEGHLYRATAKVGVTDRAQLAELLNR